MLRLRGIAGVYREAFAGLPREVWLLSLAAFVNRAGTMVVPFFALYLTQERGLPVIEAGRLVGLYGVGSLVGSYLGGLLSDRIGSIRTQHLSLIGGGIGFLAILQPERMPALAAVVFATSAVAEAFRPAAMTAIAHRTPQALQARSFALLRLAHNLGMAIGPAAGGLLATRSYALLFLADALTAWAASLLLALLLPARRAGAHDARAAAAGAGRSPWRDAPFLLLSGIVVVWAAAFLQAFSTMPIYLRRVYGMRESAIGPVLGLNALLIVAFEMVLIHWAERRDRVRLMSIGCLLVCGGLGLLPLGSTAGWAIACTVVWTLGEMLTLPLSNAAVAARATPATRGRYMGVYTMAFSSAFIVGPIAGTWVFDRFGPATLWYGIGLLGPPLGAACLALGRPLRRA
jgi:MFS family permease